MHCCQGSHGEIDAHLPSQNELETVQVNELVTGCERLCCLLATELDAFDVKCETDLGKSRESRIHFRNHVSIILRERVNLPTSSRKG